MVCWLNKSEEEVNKNEAQVIREHQRSIEWWLDVIHWTIFLLQLDAIGERAECRWPNARAEFAAVLISSTFQTSSLFVSFKKFMQRNMFRSEEMSENAQRKTTKHCMTTKWSGNNKAISKGRRKINKKLRQRKAGDEGIVCCCFLYTHVPSAFSIIISTQYFLLAFDFFFFWSFSFFSSRCLSRLSQ